MENLSPLQVIAIVVGLVVGVISIGVTFATLIYWVSKNTTQTQTNTDNIEEIYQKLEKHVDDATIHHPEAELDRRFKVLEDGMQKIEKGIDKLVQRFDNFLNK